MKLASLLLVALVCVACADVAPYDRARLAHPTMAPEHGHSLGREHLRALHEGASGGDIAVSSGCGCN